MSGKKWLKIWFIFLTTTIPLVVIFNYLVDPYGIYDSNIINKPKIRQEAKIRLAKAANIQEMKPVSVCLGISRADAAYDVSHPYFPKPSHNVAIAGGTMYENRLYFESLLKNGNLKKSFTCA